MALPIVLLAMSHPAMAQSASAAIGVDTEIVASCAIDSVTPIAFGTLARPSAETRASGAITLNCSQGTGWRVRIDQGQNYDSGLTMRRVGAKDRLAYAMCGDANCNTALDQNAGPSGTGTGRNQTVALAARIAGGQSAPPGEYSDRLTIRVDY